MIYDSAYIDFEMLLRFIDEAEGPKRILTEPEILETLRVKSVKPRAFIPIELIEEVTHFNTQDDYKHITREQYLVYLKSLLGPKSNHPTDGFVEIELDTNNLHDLAESWNAYKWESITPFVYGSSYRDYQLGDILNLEKSVTLNLLPTNKSTNSFYDEGDRIILFTVYDLESAFSHLDFGKIAQRITNNQHRSQKDYFSPTKVSIKKVTLRRMYLKGWLAGNGFSEPHHFETETQQSVWEKMGKSNPELFPPQSLSSINALFENQKMCSFKIGRRKKATN